MDSIIGNTWTMCEFHNSNSNGLGDIWLTDKCSYFSSIEDPYLFSAKAPVLEGSGSRRLYRRKGTSVDHVYVVFGARVYIGFFLLFVKNGFVVGVRTLNVTACH